MHRCSGEMDFGLLDVAYLAWKQPSRSRTTSILTSPWAVLEDLRFPDISRLVLLPTPIDHIKATNVLRLTQPSTLCNV